MLAPPRSEIPGLPAGTEGRQKLVDAYHESRTLYWKEIYQRGGVDPKICQERKAILFALVDELRLSQDSHILEVGCGAGFTSVELAQRGYLVKSIDTVRAMIDLTRRLAVESHVEERVMTSVTDVHQLAFPESTFDLVFAMGVTTCLHSLKRGVQEMVRVLKPAGFLILNVENRWRLNHILDPILFPSLRSIRWTACSVLERLGVCQPRQMPPIYTYSISEFDSFLSPAGLEKLRGSTLGFGPFSFFTFKFLPDSLGIRIHRGLQHLADLGFPILRSTGAQYIVLAKKAAAGRPSAGQ